MKNKSQLSNSKPHNFIRRFVIGVIVLLAAIALIVICIDPFFHYHEPWFGLKAVLTDKEYQCVGSLRNFNYDSLIVGSSVTENNNNAWFDETFGGKTIKAVRSYGGTADLCWLLDVAHEDHELKNVYYNIDPAALSSEATTTFEDTGCPMYLYDNNPFNDIEYLFNKDVLFEKIPYMIARSASGYDEGQSYNWWQTKTFSEDSVLEHYERPSDTVAPLEEKTYEYNLKGNIALLTKEVSAHPETDYYFFFPPYSVLWWDNTIRCGELNTVLYDESQCMKALLEYDNVRVYNFMAREDITTDLNNYMDTLHFTPEINHSIVGWLSDGTDELHSDEEVDAFIAQLREFADTVETEEMPQYAARLN